MLGYKDCTENWSRAEVAVGVLMVSLGGFTSITATTLSVQQYYKGFAKSDTAFIKLLASNTYNERYDSRDW